MPATAAKCAVNPAGCPNGRCGEGGPKNAPPPKGYSVPYGSYSNITVPLQHFGGHLATD